uniref:Putative secreted protein n=1 Tax=Ixodes ricinus TaxID=34613 RepID=V5GGJ7_IXORI
MLKFAAVLLLAVAVSAVPLKFNPQGDLDTAAQTFHAVHAADDFSQPTPYSYKHETTGEDGAVTVHRGERRRHRAASVAATASRFPNGRQRTRALHRRRDRIPPRAHHQRAGHRVQQPG